MLVAATFTTGRTGVAGADVVVDVDIIVAAVEVGAEVDDVAAAAPVSCATIAA